MGTIIKYIFYAILLVVIYLVGRGIYEGSITQETTVGNVVDQVETGSKEILDNTTENVKRGYENVKASSDSATK